MNQQHKFDCSMLRRLNPRLELLTSRINAAESITEKVRLAGELEQEVSALLDCASHQAGEPECGDCRLIAGLRSRAARTVARAGQIIEFRDGKVPGSEFRTRNSKLETRNFSSHSARTVR